MQSASHGAVLQQVRNGAGEVQDSAIRQSPRGLRAPVHQAWPFAQSLPINAHAGAEWDQRCN
jgi:hypothetical protein